MWPASKVIPKELFPLGRMPAIAHVIWEMVDAGIEDIRIVVRKGESNAIDSLLDPGHSVPPASVHADPVIQRFERMIRNTRFSFVEQEGPYGNGTPLLNGIGDSNEPCIFAFADDVVFGENSVSGMIAAFERGGHPVLAVQPVAPEETRKFGILECTGRDGLDYIERFVEKPGPGETTSTLASLGRYLVTPELVEILRNTPLGKANELWLSDAFVHMLRTGRPLTAFSLSSGEWHTVGTPEGFARAATAAIAFESLAETSRTPV